MSIHDDKFIPGYKINMLSFVRHAEQASRTIKGQGRIYPTVVLICDCGKTVTKDRYAWLSGRQKSCGCYGEAIRGFVHGGHGTPLYLRWASMKARTTPGTAANNGNYVGVKRDPRWDTFEGFRDNPPTTGRPFGPGLELARFNDVGDYTPDNTRWLTKSENVIEALDRRRLRLPDGRIASHVARENGIPLGTWEARYYMKGIDLTTAVTVRNFRKK
jgi:hypothetical protein